MSLKDIFPRVFYVVGIVAFLLIIWLLPPVSDWFNAFVKLKPMRIPYTVVFFISLFFLLFFLYPIADKKPFFALLISGFFSGQLISFLSIFIANLFIKNGIERTIKTIDQEGVFNVFLTDFSVALILGGWLISIVSIIILKFAVKRVARQAELAARHPPE
ncbi:MAG: hypothetical protein IPK63_21960 [Candidatus Competibacteraceae bacterium]|nr:hypothetical protein [Candidatus Competibacteraceae bacterium]